VRLFQLQSRLFWQHLRLIEEEAAFSFGWPFVASPLQLAAQRGARRAAVSANYFSWLCGLPGTCWCAWTQLRSHLRDARPAADYTDARSDWF